MVERLEIPVLFEPFHRRFFFTGGQRCIPILIGHSLHISGRDGGGGGLDSVTVSMYGPGWVCEAKAAGETPPISTPI
jgi:hypothetical protein